MVVEAAAMLVMVVEAAGNVGNGGGGGGNVGNGGGGGGNVGNGGGGGGAPPPVNNNNGANNPKPKQPEPEPEIAYPPGIQEALLTIGAFCSKSLKKSGKVVHQLYSLVISNLAMIILNLIN